ncbi:MAG: amino acid ABC transporter substrate-binding protein, partial [Candidatus Ornithomonoglobus sp.]
VMAGGSVGEGTSFEDLAIIDLDFESEEYGIAFRQGSDVTEEVNAAMQELAADGTLQTIAEKYGVEDLLLVK